MLRANTFGEASANGTPQANEKHCSQNCSLTIVTTCRDNVDRPPTRNVIHSRAIKRNYVEN